MKELMIDIGFCIGLILFFGAGIGACMFVGGESLNEFIDDNNKTKNNKNDFDLWQI